MTLIHHYRDKSKELIDETIQGYQEITHAFFEDNEVEIEMILLHLYGVHIKIAELLKDIERSGYNPTILRDEVRTLTLFKELLNGSQKIK